MGRDKEDIPRRVKWLDVREIQVVNGVKIGGSGRMRGDGLGEAKVRKITERREQKERSRERSRGMTGI